MVGHGIVIDIAFAVMCCANYIINPWMVHWYALLRILRPLKGTKGFGLVYRGQLGDDEFGCCSEGFLTIRWILGIYREGSK